jgi:hypothetical protein
MSAPSSSIALLMALTSCLMASLVMIYQFAVSSDHGWGTETGIGEVDIGLQEMGLQPDKVLKLAGVTLKC